MTPERWQQIDNLFHQVQSLPAEERAAVLEAACAGDADLYAEVISLLESDAADVLPGLDAPHEALVSLMEDEGPPAIVGQRVGPYRIAREIGRGGMGAVYLAHRADQTFDKQVALKLVKRGMATDEILQRFRHERQILAALEHPHIARLHDGGATDDGRPYLIMEYVDGQPVHHFCDQRTLTVHERLAVFQTICEAVHYAHQNLVVHRDLKPSNILVTDDGKVKLLDFGIAKLLTDDGTTVPMTQTGVRLMTPAYAAPEQVRGAPVTTATDVYALGVVLYELLTGRRPYAVGGKPRLEIEQAVLESEPERPSTVVTKPTTAHGDDDTMTPAQIGAARATTTEHLQRQLKGDLDTILLKALQKEPVRRYTSAEAFLDDIKRHLAGLPVQARPDTVGYRLRTFVKRHRVGVAAAAAFLLLLAGVVGFYTVRVTHERNIAREERDKAEEVAAFLEDLFASANPEVQERLDTLRVRDLLSRGVARVQEDLSDQPLVQAQMLEVVGRVYNQLRFDAEAEALLRQALALRTTRYEAPHPKIADSQVELAWSLYNQGTYEEAEKVSRDALAMRHRLFGDTHGKVAVSLKQLALILERTGAVDEAEALFRDALAMNRSLLGDEHAEVAIILSGLGILLSEQGEQDEAEALFRESLALRRTLYGPDHPSLATGLNNLGALLQTRGRYVEAEPLLREALAVNRRVFGPESPRLLPNMNQLGIVLRSQQKYEAADTLFQHVLALQRLLLGPRHPNLAVSLDGYAALLKEQGLYEHAERVQREAVDIARAGYGDEHPAVFITTSHLIRIQHLQGDPAAALPLYRDVLALGERLLPADNIHVVLTRVNLGVCLFDLARYADAEPLLLDGHRALEASRGPADTFTRSARADLVKLYEAWGKPVPATAFKAAPADTTS